MLENTLAIVPSINETILAFKDMGTTGFATLVGVVGYLMLLGIPLSGIEHRDTITGLTYIVFCIAAGVTLILAVPHDLPQIGAVGVQMWVLAAIGWAATMRWILRARSRLLTAKLSSLDKNA